MPAIRYPDRSLIGTLLPAMSDRRSGAPADDTALVHVWGFTGTGRPDETNAAGFTPFSPGESRTEGSPILDIATRMMEGMGGRLWGFGLASRTVVEAVHRELDETDTSGGPRVSVSRPLAARTGLAAEEVWAATIFDGRGREYTRIQYLHLPDLEPIIWDDDTVPQSAAWIDRMAAGVVVAHVWAAAMALDATRNHGVLEHIQRKLNE
ncbi:hypothetical protein ABIA39_001492 [Nocardia sp. GAS34]|uniref:hypothetical protein n=1 Tax=unclassified Nocardia TaxID=2637762 RepID=UPI003D1D5428